MDVEVKSALKQTFGGSVLNVNMNVVQYKTYLRVASCFYNLQQKFSENLFYIQAKPVLELKFP